jgi:hypothetical protein
MEEEIKKRKGRPPGTSKKDPKEAKGPTFDITGTPKKRGRKATVKVELAPIEEVVDGEVVVPTLQSRVVPEQPER